MNLSRRHRLTSHVETGAMNDIMFFLMLFFLIASTLVNPNVIKLLLPNAKSSKQVMKQPITISVDAAGMYFVNKKPVNPTSVEPELVALIGTAPTTEQPTVVLRSETGRHFRDWQPVKVKNGDGHPGPAGGRKVTEAVG
jgi:biopolymer transport protein ExbD